MINSGYIESDLVLEDFRIKEESTPYKYGLKWDEPVYDQGSTPKCVSVCLTQLINYKLMFQYRHITRDDYFYENRSDKSKPGMAPREALEILTKGVIISGISYKPNSYSRLGTVNQIKSGLLSFGPIMIALPIYDPNSVQFWYGSGDLLGAHAVILTGYNQYGFILKNSWGPSYGDKGYTLLPYEHASRIREAWCLID